MLTHVRRLLIHPRLPLGLAVVAMLTALPALWAGWMGDDWAHRAVLGSHPPFVGVDPIRYLFRFLGPGEVNENMASAGLLTWWADPGVRAAFFRPLSSATHLLDHLLWPDSAVLQHLHSLMWGGLMTWCGVRFLQEEGTTPLAAGLAAVFFAFEDAHAVPLTWIANRNALLTTTFSILTVHAFVRWRTTGDRRMWGLSMVSLALGLCAGEAALGACAWMGARVLTRERWSNLTSLAGPFVVVVVWRLAYDALGFGADLSGLYIDPGATPDVWAGALVARWPVLAAGQLLSAPIDGWGVLPESGRLAMSVAGLGVAVAFVAVAWPALKARPSARTAALAFAFILVPFTSTFPMDRLYTFASLASALLIAEIVDHHAILEDPDPEVAPGAWTLRTWAIVGLLLWHGPVSGLARPARVAATPLMGLIFDVAADTGPSDDTLEQQTLVFIQANEFSAIYTYVKRSVPPHDHGRPRGIALLSTWWTDVKVTREDPYTLVITPEEGFLARPIDHLLRDPARKPFAVDDHVAHFGMDAHVRAVTGDGRPAVVAFRFSEPLEDETNRRFVTLGAAGVVDWTPPAVGETVVLPALF